VGKGGNEVYCNPAMDKVLAKADAQQLDQAVPEYKNAQKMMLADLIGAPLRYDTQSYVAQTYVKGTGYNGFYDYTWQGMRILKH
jgi:ABC-type oligopeptide transport system substrate-binding subunit